MTLPLAPPLREIKTPMCAYFSQLKSFELLSIVKSLGNVVRNYNFTCKFNLIECFALNKVVPIEE